MRRTVSPATLERLSACDHHQRLFERTFNAYGHTDRVEITEENVKLARDNGLNIDWLLMKVLPRERYGAYYRRRRAILHKHANDDITAAKANEQLSKLAVKYLREYWSKK